MVIPVSLPLVWAQPAQEKRPAPQPALAWAVRDIPGHQSGFLQLKRKAPSISLSSISASLSVPQISPTRTS